MYAIVKNNKVSNLVMGDIPLDLSWVDITALETKPSKGDTYENGVFTPKAPEVPTPIRIISIGSFRRRLTLAEKVAIKISTDPIVQVLSEDLLASSFVDLDFPQVIQGLQYLTTTDPVILTPERVTELLIDGTEEEV